MTAPELIGALARRLGLPDLAPEAPGRWRIVFDGQLAIDFAALAPGEIALQAALGPLPEDEFAAESLLRGVLGRNLAELGQGTARNALFLEPERAVLRMERREKSDSHDGESFAAAVEEFANAADAWLEFLAMEAAPSALPGFALRP